MPYPVNLGWIIPVEVESNENSCVNGPCNNILQAILTSQLVDNC